MGKAPAFQFYVKDWLTDVELQSASAASRGVWINALCLMWESRTRGVIRGTPATLARMLNCTPEELALFLRENDSLKFADVTDCHGEITLSNRRMVKEQKVRDGDRIRQERKRSHDACHADITHPSSSPSPSPVPSALEDKDSSSPLSGAAPDHAKSPPPIPVTDIIAAYHAILPERPCIRLAGKKLLKQIKARWEEDKARQNLPWWEGYFGDVRTMPWLMGRGDWSGCDLQWLTGPDNMGKVLNGRYRPKARDDPRNPGMLTRQGERNFQVAREWAEEGMKQ
jgi:hypothetical protein